MSIDICLFNGGGGAAREHLKFPAGIPERYSQQSFITYSPAQKRYGWRFFILVCN